MIIPLGELMADYKVALDAGHGGSDPGAVYNGRQEKDDTLDLTLAVGDILKKNGIDVFYTRTTDEYETPFKKATDANNSGADLFVSIHRNSSETPNQYSGVETLVYNDSGLKAEVARNINNQLEEVGFNNLGVDVRKNLVVLKRTKMPAVLVEAGFINNDKDNYVFDQEFDKVAQAIADGILESIPVNRRNTTGNRTSADNTGNNTNNNGNSRNYNSSNNSNTNSRNTNNTATNNNGTNNNNTSNNDSINNGNNNDNYNNRNNSGNNSTNVSKDTSDYTAVNNTAVFSTLTENLPDVPANSSIMPVSYDETRQNGYNCNCDSYETLYRVQTGAYRNKENADRMLNSLLIDGFPAFIIYQDGYYKVQVGAYGVLSNAIKMERRLRKFHYSTYITT